MFGFMSGGSTTSTFDFVFATPLSVYAGSFLIGCDVVWSGFLHPVLSAVTLVSSHLFLAGGRPVSLRFFRLPEYGLRG